MPSSLGRPINGRLGRTGAKPMISQSNYVPFAFWIGFLALGFVTSFGGPAKTHPPKDAVALDAERGRGPQTARD